MKSKQFSDDLDIQAWAKTIETKMEEDYSEWKEGTWLDHREGVRSMYILGRVGFILFTINGSDLKYNLDAPVSLDDIQGIIRMELIPEIADYWSVKKPPTLADLYPKDTPVFCFQNHPHGDEEVDDWEEDCAPLVRHSTGKMADNGFLLLYPNGWSSLTHIPTKPYSTFEWIFPYDPANAQMTLSQFQEVDAKA